ncbi:F-box domain-containing protein [Caenorhabditis elegans]|uniref:F-box domain-containing protein n=1 Tax=Caenorhabditis elegans TaxID=6239 RepID=Q9TZG4_CAEEL|nr:F-box associated domain-containing protein [Caenorhabditis elegans]CCD71280.1 F-box associated domain-containing protein [Caenorhabditis elegans]|eukprot:NP_494041.2 F-box B protein [Caenorhabditis elegans]
MTAIALPILRLPHNSLQLSLKQMSLVEHLTLSFISNKTKQLIKISMKNYDIAQIFMGLPISIEFDSRSIDYPSIIFDFNPDQEIVRIYNSEQNGSITELNLPGITEKQWIEHISSVLIQNRKVVLISSLSERKIEDIYDSIKELDIVALHMISSQFQDCNLLKLFPTLEELTVSENPLSAPIFAQNFQSLTAPNVAFDNIFFSNCINLVLYHQVISDKDLNIFMRNWIKGSNPRLRKLTNASNEHNRVIVESVFFQGIAYIETRDYCDEDTFDKEFEIKSEDGVKAKVILSTYRFMFCIEDF